MIVGGQKPFIEVNAEDAPFQCGATAASLGQDLRQLRPMPSTGCVAESAAVALAVWRSKTFAKRWEAVPLNHDRRETAAGIQHGAKRTVISPANLYCCNVKLRYRAGCERIEVVPSRRNTRLP